MNRMSKRAPVCMVDFVFGKAEMEAFCRDIRAHHE